MAFISLVVALVFAAIAAPAGAVVAKIAGHGYGITPIDSANEAGIVQSLRAQQVVGSPSARRYDVGPSGGTELTNLEGGPVMHSATTHVIYWDPAKEFSTVTKGIVDGFFTNVAHDSGQATNVFAIAGQYTDSTGHAAYSSTSASPQTDTEKYPVSGCASPEGPFADPGPPYTECMTDEQLQGELSRFITAEKLPVGPSQLYFLLLPHKVVTCFEEELEFEPGVIEQACSTNVFCAYHSYIKPGTASEIIYADIPFSLLDGEDAKGCQDDGQTAIQQPNPDNAGGKDSETRFADVALKYISHEYIEATTDPLVNEDTAWVDEQGLEIGDKCNGVHGPSNGIGRDPNAFLPTLGGSALGENLFNQTIDAGSYYLQSEWDNAAEACLMKPLSLGAGSFAPPAGTAGSSIGFSGSAFDPYGRFEPTWTFGDSGTAVGAAVSHTYAAAGEYSVTMTPKDAFTGATGAPVSHRVTVTAPASGGGGGTGGGSGSGEGGGPAGPAAAPPTSTGTIATAPPAPTPDSSFSASAASNEKSGAIVFTISLANPGTLNWSATFANGKFGAFSSSAKCKRGQIRLRGRCLPARISFAKGSQAVSAAGSATVTLKPSASALKALKSALRQKKGVPISIVLTFQSSLGGAPSSHTQTVTVKPSK